MTTFCIEVKEIVEVTTTYYIEADSEEDAKTKLELGKYKARDIDNDDGIISRDMETAYVYDMDQAIKDEGSEGYYE